jgi:hypothetical protein
MNRAWAIAAGALALGLLALTGYVWYAADATDEPWTADAGQPPAMVGLPLFRVPGGRAARGGAAKCYPASLSDWDDCVIGDC